MIRISIDILDASLGPIPVTPVVGNLVGRIKLLSIMIGIKAVLLLSLVINVLVNGYQDDEHLEGELEVLLKRLQERLEDEERGHELEDLFERDFNGAMEKFQAKLIERGSSNKLSWLFRIMDDDRSYTLSLEELTKGIRDMGLTDISSEEIKTIMKTLDKDGSGSLNVDEFYEAARPPMSEDRKKVIERVFKETDKNGDGLITPVDMKRIFNVREHPDFKNGKKTEEQLFGALLNNFEPNAATRDAKVTLAEFTRYYEGISQYYTDDADFEVIMKSYWKVL